MIQEIRKTKLMDWIQHCQSISWLESQVDKYQKELPPLNVTTYFIAIQDHAKQ